MARIPKGGIPLSKTEKRSPPVSENKRKWLLLFGQAALLVILQAVFWLMSGMRH